ncbi:hypothetical protein FISHEDRAFT_75128 [Fistulina hepatica ATCC 64428]|uniref:Uncharacterized protein n=1 Tax=Fistulina hepatica ATCC 64428 TaxID=1128425 RepID=A0A0D7AAI4_9AGAR|nr:hypothetical protein FISHEDRAFT_75128 [Fistulina hepatica ATCC 64428]
MPLTEITTYELTGDDDTRSWTCPSITDYFTHLCRQQCAWSAYPVLMFEDLRAPDRYRYTVSGWHSTAVRKAWTISEAHTAVNRRFPECLRIKSRLQLELEFDTLPRIYGTCLLGVRVDHNTADGFQQEGRNGSEISWVGRAKDEKTGVVCGLAVFRVMDSDAERRVKKLGSLMIMRRATWTT